MDARQMNEDFFDYASIMLRMDRLNKDIHQLLLEGKYEQSKPLTQELLFQTRLLHLWITQKLETHGHNYD
jgi:hypothetical protein